MGQLTLASGTENFRGELLFLLQNRTDSGVTSARLDRWINTAYTHMTHPSVHEFEELKATFDITLVSGQSNYAYATLAGYRVVAFRSLHYLPSGTPTASDRRHRLKPRNVRWYDERIHPTEEPRHYVIEGTDLLVSPVPGATQAGNLVRCRVWRERARLTNDADTTVLMDYWDQVLLRGAQALAEYELGYRDVAMESLQSYVDLLNDPTDQTTLEGRDWGFEVQVEQPPYMGVTS